LGPGGRRAEPGEISKPSVENVTIPPPQGARVSVRKIKTKGDYYAHLNHLRTCNYRHRGTRGLLPPRKGCHARASKARVGRFRLLDFSCYLILLQMPVPAEFSAGLCDIRRRLRPVHQCFARPRSQHLGSAKCLGYNSGPAPNSLTFRSRMRFWSESQAFVG
jgi:hypothetical protein